MSEFLWGWKEGDEQSSQAASNDNSIANILIARSSSPTFSLMCTNPKKILVMSTVWTGSLSTYFS